MDWTGCEYVEVIAGKVSGVPLVRDSRVPADTVWESFELGESPAEISNSFYLRPADVRAIIDWAAARTPILKAS